MKNLFINIFHEDDLSALDMQEILAGSAGTNDCMCNGGAKLCLCDTSGSTNICMCNSAGSRNTCTTGNLCTTVGA